MNVGSSGRLGIVWLVTDAREAPATSRTSFINCHRTVAGGREGM